MWRTTLVALGLLLSGCAQPQAAPTPEPSLGAQPTVVEPAPSGSPTAADVNEGGRVDSPGSPAETAPPNPQPDALEEPAPVATATTAAPSPPAPRGTSEPASDDPVVLLSESDRVGDHGLEGPAWVDLTHIELVEVGNDLRVTLRFAGELPAAPPEGQVPLVGVDIGDDGYQLFVEGGGQEWSAFLRTPDGFVSYPGTFVLRGTEMELTVPFNALGSPTRAEISVLVEWSAERPVVNAIAEDRLDGQPHTFDRNP